MPGDVLTLGREFKRRFPDQFAGMSAIEVGRQASERLGIDAPDVSRPDRRDLVDTQEYQPVRVAVPGRSAPTTRAAAQPVALRTPNAQEMDAAATQAAQERVEGVRAVARLAGANAVPPQLQLQPGRTIGPTPGRGTAVDRIGQGIIDAGKAFLTPTGIRESFDRGVQEFNAGSRDIGREGRRLRGARRMVEGVGGMSSVLVAPAVAKTVGTALLRGGPALAAEVLGTTVGGIAAGEAGAVLTEEGLTRMGVDPEGARLAGAVVDVAADPASIIAGGARLQRPPVAKPAPKAEAPTIAKPKPKPAPKVRQSKPVETATVESTPVAPKAKPAEPQAAPSRTSRVKTPSGQSVDTRLELIEASDLITSQGDNLADADPRFPRELQNRKRERAASEDLVVSIENAPDLDRLADAPTTDAGAPIVGPDNVVEVGNARTIGVRRGFRKGTPGSKAFRQALIDRAQDLGIDPDRVRSMKEPILVRRRVSDVPDRVRFIEDANTPSTTALSATERAAQDARRLSDSLLADFRPNEDTGDLAAASNRDFLRGFVESVVPASERGSVIDSKGMLSADGARRVRNAVFAKAYGDSPTLERLAEATDDNARNLTSALLRAAPRFVKLRQGIDAGDRFDLDIRAELTEAVEAISALRAKGQSVGDYLRQENLFGGRSDLTDRLIGALDANKQSAKRVGDVLNRYVELVDAIGSPKQVNLFGASENPTRVELLEAALRSVEDARAPLFTREPNRPRLDPGQAAQEPQAGTDPGTRRPQADEFIPPDPAGRGGFLRVEPRGREQAAAVGLGPNQPPQRPTISGALAKVRAEVKTKAQAIAKRADSQEFRTQLIDRTAPIQDFVETARRSGKLNPEADPGQSARLYAGAGARAEAKLDQLDEIIRPVRRDMDAALELAVFERFDELAKRGVKKFPNGMTPLEVNAGMQRIRAEIAANPNRQRRINRFLTQVRDYQNGILDELASEGIISAKGRDAIRASNEKYIPLQRIGFLADDFAKHGQPRRFSVSSQDVVQGIVGSEREIIDPLESIVRNTYKATNLIARNRVAREMFELSKLPEYQGEILPLKRGQDPPRGFDTVTYLREGQPVRYAVPSPVAAAMKNIGAVQADIITKIARLPTQSLRAGATALNAAFIPSNLRRDFETMGVTQGMGMLESAQTWASGLSEVIGGGRYFDEWRDSGGAFSGLFESLKTPQRSAKHLRRSQADRAIRKIVNPLELVRVMGEIAEQAPRVGVFKRARVKLGEGPRQAALRARDATVDFNRVGQTTAIVNQWLPFVNARLQGNLNLGKAFTDPKRRGRAMLSASQLVLAPAVATYLYNVTQHEDAYNEISDFEKQNNFVIVLGDEKDARDRLTNVIKIPKGDVGRVLGNPIESFLDYLRYRDPMAFDSLAVQVLSDVSPVSFERDGEWSTNRLLSDLTPPIFKGPLEVSLNRNLFTGREIVPKNRQGASPPLQRRFDTPSAAVTFGEFFNVSPLKVEHIIRSSFGGVGEQALMLASGQPERIGEQFERRFSSALARQSTDQAFEEAGEFKRLEEDRRVAAELEAQTLFESIKDLPPAQKKAGFQQAVAKIAERDPAHAARVVREFEGEVKRAQMTAFERYMRYSMPVAARADWIEAQIGRIQDPAQQGAFLRDLEQKKILSKAVQDELRKRRQPNGQGAPN